MTVRNDPDETDTPPREPTEPRKRPPAKSVSPADGTEAVDAYMASLEHPLKPEMEAMRAIITQASDRIVERVKWDAPSFHYKADLAAFNTRETRFVHMIFFFPDDIAIPDDGGVLEGHHRNRREASFRDMADIDAKRPALTMLVRDWVEAMDH